MKILSLECSASAASCAVIDGDVLLGESFINIKTTHSQTLLPMTENLLKSLNLTVADIDAFAIASGPGSFTGVRIGISALKGLCFGANKECVGVSTLKAMAYSFLDKDCIVCATMDARCNQVYNALFTVKCGKVERIREDRAIMCEELKQDLENILKENDLPVILCGDGAEMFYKKVQGELNIALASPLLRFQRASSVGYCALEELKNGGSVAAENLLPVYLRLPQAERELKKKQGELK